MLIAPRLYASLSPAVGKAPLDSAWGDTAVVWPESAADQAGNEREPWLKDAISGARHGLVEGALALAAVLTEFPLAALFGVLTRPHEFTPDASPDANPEHGSD